MRSVAFLEGITEHVVNSGIVGLGVVLVAVAVVGGGRVDHFNRRKRYGTRKNLDKYQKPI